MSIEEEAYYEIAKHSHETEMGARNIQRTLVQAVMEKGYYASCSSHGEKEVFITGNDIRNYLSA